MKMLPFVIFCLLWPSGFKDILKPARTSSIKSKSLDIDVNANVLEKEQVAQVIAQVGFPKEMVPMVTCLAEYESNFRPKIVNHNKNQTRDYGLLQINDVWLKGCNTSPRKLKNPFENARCAYIIYQVQGLTAWTTYKKFKNKCLSYQIIPNDKKTYQQLAESQISLATNELM